MLVTSSPGNPELALMALHVEAAATRNEDALERIGAAHDQLQSIRHELREARLRAAEAQEEAGFFGDVAAALGDDLAPVLAAAGAAALLLASGGSAAPVVIAAASLSLSAKAGEELGVDPRICAALGAAGALAGLTAGNAAGAGSAWTTAAAALEGGAGAANVGAGTCATAEAAYERDAAYARTDAKALEAEQYTIEALREDGLDSMSRAARDEQRALEVVATTQRERHRSEAELSDNVGRER